MMLYSWSSLSPAELISSSSGSSRSELISSESTPRSDSSSSPSSPRSPCPSVCVRRRFLASSSACFPSTVNVTVPSDCPILPPPGSAMFIPPRSSSCFIEFVGSARSDCGRWSPWMCSPELASLPVGLNCSWYVWELM
ncbi:hypothetical protein OGATHE_006237 [Ogataea polymorpha]|uniref:Uncharacterized protein n=1 Tax=Ogataea polymorpha TaxID=460523 RepID=A0A9P8NT44_9ASCO|nr:hypothetical protein OGATHE_006237 [Ogataea polymorpha]